MDTLLLQFLFVLLYIVLGAVLLSTTLGFPGNWVLVAAALVVALVGRFSTMTWGYLLLCVGLAVVGEIIEALLGAAIVARGGGGRWGIVGSILGGFAGVVVGAGIIPPLGSVVFAFVGAFVGAALGEFAKDRRMEPAMRVGFWSLVGRMAAVAGKLAVGCVILWIIITKTWP